MKASATIPENLTQSLKSLIIMVEFWRWSALIGLSDCRCGENLGLIAVCCVWYHLHRHSGSCMGHYDIVCVKKNKVLQNMVLILFVSLP